MYYRIMQKELEEAGKKLPIVTILGPRQSGKTTLVQQTFPEKPYMNMDRFICENLQKAIRSDFWISSTTGRF